MKRLLICVGVLTSMGLGFPSAQTPGAGLITKLDPALDAIVPANSKFEVLIEDYFGGVEGLVWRADGPSGYGYLLFSDQDANAIYKWDGKLSMFLERSGYTGDPAKWPEVATFIFNGRLHVGHIGSNGLTVDREGRVIMCARGDRALVRLEKDGTRTTLADRYEGKGLNPPNDVVVKSDGSVYFSTTGSKPGLVPNGIYRWKNGEVQLLTKNFPGCAANGLAFSPDEKFFYMAGGKICRFNVQADGTIADGRFFAGDIDADGMKVDSKGNLYFMGPGGLWIVGPDGKHLGTVATPLFRNVAFGDADRKTLYIGIQRGLARLRVSVPGI